MKLELDGAEATLLRVDGERFVLLAPRAYAPGTPLAARIGGETVAMKVSRSRRRGDAYEVEGRLVNLTREQRRLLSGLTPGDGP